MNWSDFWTGFAACGGLWILVKLWNNWLDGIFNN